MSEKQKLRPPFSAEELSEQLHSERQGRTDELNELARVIGFERVQAAGSIIEAVRQLAHPAPAATSAGTVAQESGRDQEVNDLLLTLKARDAELATLRAQLEETHIAQGRLHDEILRQSALLISIGDYAHDRSTGPAVPDALWEIRNMAYEGEAQ